MNGCHNQEDSRDLTVPVESQPSTQEDATEKSPLMDRPTSSRNTVNSKEDGNKVATDSDENCPPACYKLGGTVCVLYGIPLTAAQAVGAMFAAVGDCNVIPEVNKKPDSGDDCNMCFPFWTAENCFEKARCRDDSSTPSGSTPG